MYWFALAVWLGMFLYCIIYELRMAYLAKALHVKECKRRNRQPKLEVFDVAKSEHYQQAFKDALREERKQ